MNKELEYFEFQITHLQHLMNINQYLSPDDGEIMQFSCESKFEPYGLATEDWGLIWTLRLPKQTAYWINNEEKLVKCNDGIIQEFRGKTIMEVVAQAIHWYELYNKQIKGDI